MVSWKSKKQHVVSRSSVEAKYRTMVLVTCEIIWLKQLLMEFKFGETTRITLICDDQKTLHFTSNLAFYERIKHVVVDFNFIREKIRVFQIRT